MSIRRCEALTGFLSRRDLPHRLQQGAAVIRRCHQAIRRRDDHCATLGGRWRGAKEGRVLLSRALSVLGWSGRMSSHDSNGVDRPLLMNLYYSTGGIFSLDALQGALLSFILTWSQLCFLFFQSHTMPPDVRSRRTTLHLYMGSKYTPLSKEQMPKIKQGEGQGWYSTVQMQSWSTQQIHIEGRWNRERKIRTWPHQWRHCHCCCC